MVNCLGDCLLIAFCHLRRAWRDFILGSVSQTQSEKGTLQIRACEEVAALIPGLSFSGFSRGEDNYEGPQARLLTEVLEPQWVGETMVATAPRSPCLPDKKAWILP